jgi:hypothetical protein
MAVSDDVRSAGGGSSCSLNALAQYVDRTLPAGEHAEMERHLVGCADCREIVAEAVLFGAAEPDDALANGAESTEDASRSHRPSWGAVGAAALAAAATIVIVLRLVGVESGQKAPDLSPLVVAATAHPTRLIEGRLAGFPYRPAPLRTRDSVAASVPPTVGDAAAAIERAAASRGASSDLARGVAQVAVGELDGAVTALRRAAARAPGDAPVQSDLAAALIARAQSTGAQEDAQAALDACEHALAASRDMPEALFNKALALEALGRTDSAARAWEEYLRVDSQSEWANEARSRMESFR